MITEAELAKMVEYETGYIASNVKEIFDATNKIIIRELLEKQNKIRCGSFIFESVLFPDRLAWNPNTGEKFMKPAHLVCRARPNTGVRLKFAEKARRGKV